MRTVLGVPWALIATALSVGSGVVIALVAVPGVRATTRVSGATAVVEGVVRGVIVAVPLAVGLYACRRPAHARFGWLLVAFSGVWFLALSSSSASPVVYSVGRVASWISEVALGWALLAFPTGRLEARIDRVLLALGVALAAILYLPTAFLLERYPQPSPWDSCDTGCPHNAFMVAGHQLAFIDGFIVPVREILLVLLFVAIAARVTARLRAANTLMRRTLAPVLAASSARWLLFAAALVMRRVGPHSRATHGAMWAIALMVAVIALAFLAGLVRWRVFIAAAVLRVHARLRGMPAPQQVRDVLADEFEDPALQIGYWMRKRRRWIAADGLPVDPPDSGSGRHLSEVRDDGQRIVAILHDAALREEHAFIDVASSLATMASASDRLTDRTAGMLRELKASRARVAAAADSERRRIERDLHDGAQQRLVALRIQLELAAGEVEHENPTEAANLRGLGTDVDLALEEIRSLAHGIYPAILSDRGLAEALGSAALRSPIPTTVTTEGLADYPQEIATAVYLCCVEALQNVAKHAQGATTAQIALKESNSVLRFSVSDNGIGFLVDHARVGAGIINMRDRLATIGGELTVHSRPGHGTSVSGRIPLSLTPRAPTGNSRQSPRLTRPATRRATHDT